MAQRIRYKDTKKPGIVVSTKIYTSQRTGAQYKVFLDLNEVTYKIKNVNSENCHYGGENINNLNVLKRAAKSRLEGMGVSFEDEVRDRTFGRCDKGYSQRKHELRNQSHKED